MEKETVKELLTQMPSSPPKMWSMENYQIFLDHIGLGTYKKIFRNQFLNYKA